MGQTKKPGSSPKRRNVLGPALRAARERKGYSQAELAAQLQLIGWDVGRTTWTKIELGERTVSDAELVAVARLLDMSLDAAIAEADPEVLRSILGTLRR